MSEDTQAYVESFRAAVEAALSKEESLGTPQRVDRPDGSTLTTRFPVADHLWIELGVRPQIPQIRAGIMTDDRWVSEDLEQAIEDSGDSMSEFVELGFDEAGLEWVDPPVEHYREQGQYFYFSTGFEVAGIEALNDPATRDKTIKMLRGYLTAFQPAVEKLTAEDA